MTGIKSAVVLFFALTASAFAADVQISQLTDNPDPAIRTGEITYSVAILNTSNDTAADVVLSMPLPAKTSFVSVDNGSCLFDGGVPGTIVCNLGNITGDGLGNPVINVNMVLSTNSDAPGVISLTATGTTSSTDINPANDNLTQNTTINDGADLLTTVTDNIDPVVAGANLSYIISTQNLGPNDASTITVVNTLPAGVSFLSASGTGWSCGVAGQDVSCTRASIANATSAPDITVNGIVTGAISGTITDSVTVTAITGDPDLANNTSTEDTVVNIATDLALSITTSTPVIGDNPVTFTLAPRNNGPFDATTVVVTDTIPGNVAYTLASGSGWTCSHTGEPLGGTVSCTRATYIVGATNDITITAVAPSSGGFTNNASISSGIADANGSNNSDSAVSTVIPDGANLRLTKTKSPDPVAQGSNMTSTLSVSNLGPKATSGVLTVTDNLDAGETFSSFSGTNWSCVHNGVNPGGVTTCTYSATPLAANASASTLSIVTTATNAGLLANSATVVDVGGQPDNVSGNETDSASVTSTALVVDLSIAKTATTANANTQLETGENTLTYTITLTNNGPDNMLATDADAVLVRDVIPSFLSGVAAAIPNTTGVSVADNSGGKFSCTTGSTLTCRLNNGATLANAEVVIFTVNVDRPLDDGALTNTATVSSTQLGDNVPGNNSASAGASIDPIADVQIDSVIATPNPVKAGTEATYVISLRNNGPSSAANVELLNTFAPPGGRSFTLISSVSSKGSCAALVGNSINCSIGSLSRDESETVTLVIRPDWDVNNNAWVLGDSAVISTTSIESNAANNTVSINLNVDKAELDLLVNKTDLTDPIGYVAIPVAFPASLDNVIVYRVDITNNGPSLATNVLLSDEMTPKVGKQLTFLCDDAGNSSCNPASSFCNNTGVSIVGPATLNISCGFADLATTASVSRHLFFEVDSSPDSTGDTHSNVARIAASEDDIQPANDNESETSSVRDKLDLAVAKAPSIPNVDLFQPFDWDIIVSNNGPGISTDSTLLDNLPAGSELTGPPVPAQGTCSGVAGDTSINCNLGTIINAGSVVVTVPVRVTVFPAGGTLTNTANVNTFGVDSVPANDSDNGTVTVLRSSIAGTVFNDIDDNGIQDAVDSGIAAVVMTLTGTDAYGNSINQNTTTDANGDYLFDSVPTSDGTGYTLTETQPSGFTDGLDSIVGVIIAGSRSSDTISSIAVALNTSLIDYDFAELGRASISGLVWVDENNDGVKDITETNTIASLQINLTGTETVSGLVVNLSTNTAADGSYQFIDLRAGTYSVNETQPTSWGDGIDTAGSFGGVVGADQISNIVLAGTNNAINYNFAEVGASLAGSVYRDLDNDGVFDAAEQGLENIALTLTGIDNLGNAINLNQLTDVNGNYIFLALPRSNGAGYTLTETQPTSHLDGLDAVGSLGGNNSVNDVISAIVTNAGVNGINNNFGESGELNSSISGTVFSDFNDDGLQGLLETGISNVSLRLIGTDGFGNNIDRVATTNVNGDYLFNSLAISDAAGYSITETQPSGFDDGLESINGVVQSGTRTTDTVNATILVINTHLINDNFANIPIPSISGIIWIDSNNDGALDVTESLRLAGVTVTLTGNNNLSNAVNLTTLTDANGVYVFDNLLPSDANGYTITETQPASWSDGLEALGMVNGIATGIVGDDSFNQIVILGSQAAINYNFAEVGGSLAGKVFGDNNNDGVVDTAENGIAGVTLTFSGTSSTGVDSCTPTCPIVVTDVDGNYSFDDLESGNYSITETQPTGYLDGIVSSGNLGGLVGVNQISMISLGSGAIGSEYNFAEIAAEISGNVYLDLNNDGSRDADEIGIEGVDINLSGTDVAGNLINQSMTTDLNGSFRFVGLPPSDLTGYTLTETQPTGWLDGLDSVGSAGGVVTDDIISGIILNNIVLATGYNFGELGGSLSGGVFVDNNNNGTQQENETGIEDVIITLTGTDDLSTEINLVSSTDAFGDYGFKDLRPGTYTLTESQPVLFSDGIITAGNLGGTIGINVISEILLSAGDDGREYNFAELTGSIAGSVYLDSNDSGVRDAIEAGIEDVVIRLSGIDDEGNPVSLQTLTDVNGGFIFAGLPPSDASGYGLMEIQPTAWADGRDSAGTAGGLVGNDEVTAIQVILTTTATGYDFGERGGSLSGTVFNDLNNDGIQDSNEPGIPAVSLILNGTDVLGNPISMTVMSTENGSYKIPDLPLSDTNGYSITEIQPPETDDGIVTAGSLGGVVEVNLIRGIRLPASGADGVGYNFAEISNLVAEISGRVWLDIDHNRLDNEISSGREGWEIQLIVRNDPLDNQSFILIATVFTDSNGNYQFSGLLPANGYEIRFLHPQGGYVYGGTISNHPGAETQFGTIRNINLVAGAIVTEQNLPLDPSGVVYDALTRITISGVTVTLEGPTGFDANIHLVGGSNNLSQITSANGEYQFLLLDSSPAGEYRLILIEPAGYLPGGSVMIPVCDNSLNVATVPDPALVQNLPTAPASSVNLHDSTLCPQDSSNLAASANSTQYYLRFNLTPGVSANLLSNHIPIDPVTDGAITVVKTSPKVTVSRGEMVPYSLRYTNNLTATVSNINLIDQLPPGFKYVKGSSTVDGVTTDPLVNGRQLTWENISFTSVQVHLVKMLLVVGSGVAEGEYVNLAWATNNIVNQTISNQGMAKVRVIPDPTFDCTDIIGKVFDDQNLNGYQDKGEPGLAGVRVVTARGLLVTTDAKGRYHIACAAVANEIHGSNFILKLDQRSLPSGYRVTTENPRVIHLSRGKLSKINFGAAIHRVVRVELSAQAFQINTAELSVDTINKQQQLLQLLTSKVSVLRLVYHLDTENKELVDDRLNNFVKSLEFIWDRCDCGYELIIEKEKIRTPEKLPLEVQMGGEKYD